MSNPNTSAEALNTSSRPAPATRPPSLPVETAAQQRQALWLAGFPPVPVANLRYPPGSNIDRGDGKRALAKDWNVHARSGRYAAQPPHEDATNTGVLCDGLRVLDVDVDDAAKADAIAGYAVAHFGIAPVRTRANSGRVLLVYRAAEGEPGKRTLTWQDGSKIEVLGRGQQFVAYGWHNSGAMLEWLDAPDAFGRDKLPAVTEEQIGELFAEAARQFGPAKDSGASRASSPASGDETPDLSKVKPPSAAAVVTLLERLPNPLDTSYDDYKAVMLAASGAAKTVDDPEGEAAIAEAAVSWALRWEGFDGTDEAAKWENEWSTRPPIVGWQALENRALRSIPGYRAETAADELPPLPPEPPPTGRHYRQITSRDTQFRTDRQYIIKGLLSPGDVAALVGQPSAGKTTLALHLAHSVARGAFFMGLRTRQGMVLYVAAESFSGVEDRLQASAREYGHTDNLIVTECGNLRDQGAQDELYRRAVGVAPALLIIDTLGAAFAGLEENDSAGMGAVVQFTRRLAATGMAVLLIHHPAKTGDGSPRGHSSLNGTLDMSLNVAADDLKDADTVVRGTMLKNRNGTTAWQCAFTKQVVTLGTDDDGDDVTTTLVKEVDVKAEARTRHLTLTDAEAVALGILEEMERNADGAPVAEEDWRAQCVAAPISTSDNPRTRHDRIVKIERRLFDKRRISVADGIIATLPGGSEFTSAAPLSEDTAVAGNC